MTVNLPAVTPAERPGRGRGRELTVLVRDALSAKAITALGVTPRRRPSDGQFRWGRRSHTRGPLAVALVLLWTVAACSSTSHPGHKSPTTSHPASATKPAAVPTATHTAAPGAPVHTQLLESDGQSYGVGMPIIMRFTRTVTNAHAFEKAVKVDVNGTPANGAWYWERSGAKGFAVEAHYRTRVYWPAQARITVAAPLKGLSAGRGLTYDNSLTLSMSTGAAHVSTVDNSATHPRMTVTSDGKVVKTLAVSLGKASTPTYRGTKIVMELDRHEQMEALSVAWSVRLTNSGEFAHAAPWNSAIGQANLSHGCTNLSVADAQWFYDFSRIGDVVNYPNAPGPTVKVWDGYGDWNLNWSAWRNGGLLAPAY